MRDSDEPEQLYTVTMVLRNNGVVEVYSDFEYVNTIYLGRKFRPRFIFDIECDSNNFYLQCLDLTKPKNE